MRWSRGALVMLGALAACDPKPGARLQVHGTVAAITDDPGLGNRTFHKHAVADGKFFWTSGGWLSSRPIVEGEKMQLASVADDADVVATRDDVVTFVTAAAQPESSLPRHDVVAVPRAGGALRQFPLPPSVHDVAELRALSDAVLFLDTTLLYTNRADQPPIKSRSRIMMVRPRDEHPEARPIGGDSAGEIVRLETDGRAGFVVAVATATGYRLDVYDRVDAPPRTVHELPFAQFHESSARDEMDLVLGSAHVFLTAPRHALMSTTQPLLAVPRQGGPPVTVHGAMCAGTVTAAGDVPYFVTPAKGVHCPGEFPVSQKLELHRGSLTKKPLLLYEAYDSSLWLEQVAANQIILREGVGIPKPEGTAPESRYRSALFTFEP